MGKLLLFLARLAVARSSAELRAAADALSTWEPGIGRPEQLPEEPSRAAPPPTPRAASGAASGGSGAAVAAAAAASAIAAAAESHAALADCWRDGFTPEMCCGAKRSAGCWDAVFTRERCCKPDTAAPLLSAEVAALVESVRSKADSPESVAKSEADSPESVESVAKAKAPERQSRSGTGDFLQREALRRWPGYFRRAREVLLSRSESGAEGKDPVQEIRGPPKPPIANIAGRAHMYHLVYEAVNQLIGGLQLAAEAIDPLPHAFAEAAQLLRLLATRSLGTPFEHEDFAAQAEAAAALGGSNRTEPKARALRHTWVQYLDEGLAKALWRSEGGNSFNPSEVHMEGTHRGLWQLFPTYVMAKALGGKFTPGVCQKCGDFTEVVLQKYHQFWQRGFADHGPTEVNNAFFNWQLTHEAEQDADRAMWPELYRDPDFQELKWLLKLACLEYLQQIFATSLTSVELNQMELSVWASVTKPHTQELPGLAFHDHPLALVSGVFYADAGGDAVSERTPTVFADPRGTRPFRYTSGEAMEPVAPFHRLAYSHAVTGLALVFPSWLVHGVAPHRGSRDRVVFAYNLHTTPGREAFADLLRRLSRQLSEEAVERLMKVVDRNHDDSIQYEEFLDWCLGGGDGSSEVLVLGRLNNCKKVTTYVRQEALAFLGPPGRSALFPDFSEALRGDPEICLKAMGELSVPMRYATEHIRDSKEVALALVKQHSRNFRYASERLRNDKDFVMSVIQTHLACPWCVEDIFEHVSRVINGDLEIMMAAVQLQPLALRFATPKLRDSKELVLAAVTSKRCTRHSDALGKDFSLWFPKEEFAGDKEVMLVLVRKMPLLLNKASKKLRGDRDLVEAALHGDGDALEFASEELRADRSIVSLALEHAEPGRDVLQFAAEELRQDVELLALQAVARKRRAEEASKPLALAKLNASGQHFARTRDLMSLLDEIEQDEV
ncbi:unnamed protein product [Effrenium voratum]|nr:unnamed protein product [Effrenium voratum]